MRRIAAALVVITAMPAASYAQDVAAGENSFKKCRACHVIDKDQNRVGPSLLGVVGRKAGTHPNFAYSKAMLDAGAAGVVWDEATLAKYLKNPKDMVKGTKMSFAGIKDDAEIANLIAYMKTFPKAP